MTQCTANSSEIAASSFVYSLLARLWLREMDASMLASLHDTELGKAFVAAGGVVPTRSDLDDLAVEYCRLFVGPKEHLPPFQSVWEKGQLQSEIAASVQQFADLLHYQRSLDNPATMIDHLGMQLDIMAQATQQAAANGSSLTKRLAQDVAGEFFVRHLCWPDALMQSAARRSTNPFYSSMITMTAEFLTSQRDVWVRVA